MPRGVRGGASGGVDELGLFVWDPISRYITTKLNRLTSFVPPPPIDPYAPRRKVLMVHAHPNPDSFNTACMKSARDALLRSGHEVRLLSLYKEKDFQPCLSLQDHQLYRTPLEERPSDYDPAIKRYVQDLKWCTALVLVYPTWWFYPPAILKGWIERTMLPHSAFEHPYSTGSATTSTGLIPLLTNIEKIGVVTSYGASNAVLRYVGDPSRRMVARGLRPLMHPDCTVLWLGLYEVNDKSDEQRKEFLEKVSRAYEHF